MIYLFRLNRLGSNKLLWKDMLPARKGKQTSEIDVRSIFVTFSLERSAVCWMKLNFCFIPVSDYNGDYCVCFSALCFGCFYSNGFYTNIWQEGRILLSLENSSSSIQGRVEIELNISHEKLMIVWFSSKGRSFEVVLAYPCLSFIVYMINPTRC